VRATYRRIQGTEQFLGFYTEVSEAFRRLRRCYPRRKLFVVLDNLRNVHDHPTFLALLRQLRIHPVWTPAESSWLNLIEAQFGFLKRFTLTNTDDQTHAGTPEHPLANIRHIKLDKH
jgi:hypothetical protein